MSTGNWKDIAELVGIFAIVASLVAVIAELRQTQSALAASTYQARAMDAMDMHWDIANGTQIARLLGSYNMSDPALPEILEGEDLIRVRILMNMSKIDMDNEFYQYQQGFLDEEYFEYSFKPELRATARNWRRFGITEERPSFKAFVDEQLAAEE